jgi:hypothetical protein
MSVTQASLLGDTFGSSASGTIPVGGIIMWSGAIANIPTGWSLCNGSNGTPDLRNRFIIGAHSGTTDTTYPNLSPGATGGSADATLVSHNHTATSTVSDPGHLHPVPNSSGAGPNISAFGQGGVNNQGTYNTFSATTGITVSTTVSTQGSSATNANLPPYYALAFIMRVS